MGPFADGNQWIWSLFVTNSIVNVVIVVSVLMLIFLSVVLARTVKKNNI